MILSNLPESIAYERVVEMLDEIGIPMGEVTAAGVVIGWNTISCEVYAVNDDGHRYLDERTGDAAKHRVTIRLDHAPSRPLPARPAGKVPRTLLLAVDERDGRACLGRRAIPGCVFVVTPRSVDVRARGLVVDKIVETAAFQRLDVKTSDAVRAAVLACLAATPADA